MTVVTDEALVVSISKWKESSLIIRCLTKNSGKLSLIARGIRRAGRRSGAAPGTFCLANAVYYEKAGRDLYNIKEITPLNRFSGLGAELLPFAAASAFFEILDLGLPPREERPDIFQLTLELLNYLISKECDFRVVPVFFLRLISLLGFQPSLEKCSECGRRDDLKFFDPRAGEVLCGHCPADNEFLLYLPGELRNSMLKSLSQGKGITESKAVFPENQHHRFFRLMRKLVEYHFESGLRSMGFLEDILTSGDA